MDGGHERAFASVVMLVMCIVMGLLLPCTVRIMCVDMLWLGR